MNTMLINSNKNNWNR